jgi:hypothetical protein
LPFITPWIDILRIDLMGRVNYALFDISEIVGFFADVIDLLDFNMPKETSDIFFLT